MKTSEALKELAHQLGQLRTEVRELRERIEDDDPEVELDLGSGGGRKEPLEPAAGVEPEPHATAPQARVIAGDNISYRAPTEAQARMRRSLRSELGFENLGPHWGMVAEDPELKARLEAAYVQAGPLWLYDADRDYLMGLHGHVRARMAQDVSLSGDVQAAQDFAADVLKDPDYYGMGPDAEKAQYESWAQRGGTAPAGAYRAS